MQGVECVGVWVYVRVCVERAGCGCVGVWVYVGLLWPIVCGRICHGRFCVAMLAWPVLLWPLLWPICCGRVAMAGFAGPSMYGD